MSPSRIIDGLKTNSSCQFYVVAKNIVGQWSDLPSPVSITTTRDTSAPSAPTNFTVLTLPNLFLFNWTQVTNVDMRGGGYRLYVNTTNDSAGAKLIKEIGYNSEWAMVGVGERSNDNAITISAGTTYWWWLTAIDASTNETSRVASSPASASVSSASSVTIRRNTGTNIGTRPRLNFIEGANIALTIADDSTDNEVDITIASTNNTFTKEITVLNPSPANIILWRAPVACTLTALYGYRVGGTGAEINARRNGTLNHLATNLSLTSADTWMSGGTVQNGSYSAGDKLEAMIVSVSGSPTQVAVLANFTIP